MIDFMFLKHSAEQLDGIGYAEMTIEPKTVLALLDMLEAAKLDAARIDWLIGQDNCVVAEGLNGFWLSWIDEHDQRRTKYQDGSYPSARAAIDAAMAATKGEQA